MKMMMISEVGRCRSGLSAHWAWSVRVSASSKMMTFGGILSDWKKRLCMRLSTNG